MKQEQKDKIRNEYEKLDTTSQKIIKQIYQLKKEMEMLADMQELFYVDNLKEYHNKVEIQQDLITLYAKHNNIKDYEANMLLHKLLGI